jgi:hypothetical protein
MEVEARMFGEPVFNFLFLVGRVVVGNAVNVQLFGGVAVNGFEKLQKLLMAMLGMQRPMTSPFSTSSAANNVVVPLRL